MPGPRLSVGVGPVSTTVETVGGSQDLIVADSGSNDVRILTGLGNGFFDDQNATVVPVGVNPTTVIAGQFTNANGPQFVTVNAGSNDVSLITNVFGGVPVVQSFATGGVSPIAGFATQQPGSNLESLVVANNGDGSSRTSMAVRTV